MSSKRQRQAKANIPEVPQHPMHIWPESLEKRFEREGIEDQTTSTIIRGMSDAKKLTDRLSTARKKVLQDRTMNTHGKKVEFAKFTDAKGEAVLTKLNQVQSVIDKRVDELNERISTPISQEATGRFTQEARAHVKSLDDMGARIKFVKDHIEKGDFETSSAILGGPAYLSGLSEEHHENLKNHYKKRRFSEEFKTVEAYEKLNKQLFKRVKTLVDYRDSLKTKSVLRDIVSQEERRKAMN